VADTWYQEHKQKLQAEQANLSRDQVKEALQQQAEHVFDPATAEPVKHAWVQRGIKLSCEGAGHPHHQTWLKHEPVTQPRLLPM
jgi:hypothetical protein